MNSIIYSIIAPMNTDMLTPNFNIAINGSEGVAATRQLVMIVAPKFFTYMVLDADRKEISILKQYQLDFFPDKTIDENLADILTGDEILQGGFEKSCVIYDFPAASLIPEEYFHTSLNKPTTEILYGDVEKGLLLSEKITRWKAYNIYRIPREMHTSLQQRFGLGKYWHYHTLWLDHADSSLTTHRYQLQVRLKEDSMAVALFKKDQLLLVQQYPFENPEDMNYYLLLIVQQFALHPAQIDIEWSGKHKFAGEIHDQLHKYFSSVKTQELITGWSLGAAFNNIPVHHYTNYLNLAACV